MLGARAIGSVDPAVLRERLQADGHFYRHVDGGALPQLRVGQVVQLGHTETKAHEG